MFKHSDDFFYSFNDYFDFSSCFLDPNKNENFPKIDNSILFSQDSKSPQEQVETKINELSTKETLKYYQINSNEIESEKSHDIIFNNYSNNYSNKSINNLPLITKSLKNEITALKKKRKCNTNKCHDKFTDDNLRKKIKHLVLKNLLNFINNKITEKYPPNINKGNNTKKLLEINQKQKINVTIQFNQDFLYKTIGEIFSENISSKYTKYPLSHNKNVIQTLLNAEDINKRIYFNNLFKLTFIDSIRHFRGSQVIEELVGMEVFDSIKKEFENDIDYLNSLQYYLMNYEDILNNKIIKKSKKKGITGF